jgi:hypothetical protein
MRPRRPTQWLHKQAARLHASDLGPSPPPTASHRPTDRPTDRSTIRQQQRWASQRRPTICIRNARSLASNAHRPPFLLPTDRPTDRRTDQDLHALHWTAAAAATELRIKHRRDHRNYVEHRVDSPANSNNYLRKKKTDSKLQPSPGFRFGRLSDTFFCFVSDIWTGEFRDGVM